MKLPGNLSLDSLSERDLRTLKIGGIAAALLLVYVLIQLDSSVSSAHKRIVKKIGRPGVDALPPDGAGFRKPDVIRRHGRTIVAGHCGPFGA